MVRFKAASFQTAEPGCGKGGPHRHMSSILFGDTMVPIIE